METVVKLESFVPDIYKDSRDFKVFLKLLDFVYESVKYDVDNWITLYDPMKTPDDFLPLLGEMLGFDNDIKFSTSELRIILSNFIEVIKNRGSRLGIRRTIISILNAKYISSYDNENLSQELRTAIHQLDYLNDAIFFDYDTGHIQVHFPKKVDYYKDFYNYIRPVGTYIDFILTDFPEPESDVAISTTASYITHKDFKLNVERNSDGDVTQSDETYQVEKSQDTLSQIGSMKTDLDSEE